jgi:ankyrin repeat protein
MWENRRMRMRLSVALSVMTLTAATVASAQAPQPAEIRDAATKALATITAAQATWAASKQVCTSCHHQYQPALAYDAARRHGLPVDEPVARADAAAAFTFADLDRAIQYTHVIEPAVDDAYRMVAAHAAGVVPNLGASVYARLLISRQNADGTWDSYHQRPPSSYSRFMMTAVGLRAVQIYHHRTQQAQARASMARARAWLESHRAPDTEGRAYQLLGLAWAGADRATLQRLAGELEATQTADGGWSSIDGRDSESYSTGQALVALHDAAAMPASDPAWQRGLAFLVHTQAADGTWHVTSRLHPPAPLSPPYFEAGYPYGHDQFISMSGASWAVMALAGALGPSRPASVPALPAVAPTAVPSWAETALFGSTAELARLLDGGLDANAATAGGTTVLMMAAPDAAKMRLLLDRGARVNTRAKSRFSALMVAAQYQEADEAIALLIDRGADVTLQPGQEQPVFNANPFFLASYAGNARSLARLHEAGAPIDEPMLLLGSSRVTPLFGALVSGDMAVAQALFDLGAPTDFADRNEITMLGRAVLNNDVDMAALLVGRGADVNHLDKFGMTPLLWAASIDFGDSQMIDLLLKAGARADMRTKEGATALDLARRYNHTHLIARLAR